MSLIVAACAYPLALFYREPRLVPITLLMATTFIWTSLAIQHSALLNRQMKYTHLAAIQISSNALSLAIAIALAWSGADYWALVAREVLRTVLSPSASGYCLPWIPSLPSRKARVSSMLSFGGDLTAFNLVYFISSSVDKVLIGRLFGAASLGMYRQGAQLAVLPASQLVYPVNNVAQSVLSRLQSDPERYRRSYSKLLTALCAVVMPLMLFLASLRGDHPCCVRRKVACRDSHSRFMAIASFMDPAAATVGSVMLTCGKSRRFLSSVCVSSLIRRPLLSSGSPGARKGSPSVTSSCSYVSLVPFSGGASKTPRSPSTLRQCCGPPMSGQYAYGGSAVQLQGVLDLSGCAADAPGGSALALPLYFSFWLLLPGGQSRDERGVARPLLGIPIEGGNRPAQLRRGSPHPTRRLQSPRFPNPAGT